VFFNAGGGTFSAPVTYAIAGAPGGITSADFNGDGLPDLVVTMAQDTMSVLLSKCE
jgi:hypothetical protein